VRYYIPYTIYLILILYTLYLKKEIPLISQSRKNKLAFMVLKELVKRSPRKIDNLIADILKDFSAKRRCTTMEALLMKLALRPDE